MSKGIKQTKRDLARRAKQVRRQAAQLSAIGDQVYADKATHDAALQAAEKRGAAKLVAELEECKSITQVRKVLTEWKEQ